MVKNPYSTPQRDFSGLVTESQTILECESESCQRTSSTNKDEPSMHDEVRKRGSNLRNPRRLSGCDDPNKHWEHPTTDEESGGTGSKPKKLRSVK